MGGDHGSQTDGADPTGIDAVKQAAELNGKEDGGCRFHPDLRPDEAAN